jgi:hypothetical protein
VILTIMGQRRLIRQTESWGADHGGHYKTAKHFGQLGV